jgi:solute:Na+ symporter, SSS family
VVCRHVLKRAPKPRELVRVARLSNLLILAIAMVIMANLGSIQAAWFISLLFGAGMGSVLVLRWLWERINVYSELAAMALSLVTAPLLLYFLGTDPEDEWIRLGLMALVTTTAAIGVSFITPRTDDETLKVFYTRVRPFGLWGRTAQLCGGERRGAVRAAARPAAAVVVCAVSLFALLVGAGRLLFAAPDSEALLSWSFLGAGLVLTPAWLHLMRAAGTGRR